MTTKSLARLDFDAPELGAYLDALRHDSGRYDELEFGLVVTDLEGTIIAYNRVESQSTGLRPDRALGLNLFRDVLPCTNNYLVSDRFADEPVLDETIAYILTSKLRPTAVKLRMLEDERSGRQYLAIKR